MFAVLYRWRLKAGTEATFCEAWGAATDAIQRRYGTSGSRLHRTDEGEHIAYAVWPSRALWEQAQQLPSEVSPETVSTMRACIEQSLGATPLAVIEDRLGGPPSSVVEP